MAFYTKTGKFVYVGTAIATAAACCCSTGTTECCPSDTLPATLYATFTGGLANLGTVQIDWNPGSGAGYIGTSNACGATEVTVTFDCQGGGAGWQLSTSGGDGSVASGSVAQASCNPFSWTSTDSTTGDGCPDNSDTTVTISE